MSKSECFAVAMTYCGAVIGAGFATGREVVDFFAYYGRQGLGGALLATVLFMWAGYVILDVTHRNPVYSYLDFLHCVLRFKLLVRIADLLFWVTLLIGIGVMTAAGGTVLAEWGIIYPVGCGAFLAVCLLLLRTGGAGFVKANSWLVPGMSAAIIILCVMQIALPATVLTHSNSIGSALLYVSFNTAIAAVALATLKSRLNERIVRLGGLGGGLLIGILLMTMYGATVGLSGDYTIPMNRLAEIWLGQWRWIYSLVLLAAVLTTALANMHGLACRAASQGRYWTVLLLLAVMGLAIAQYGFANLVRLSYPLLGLCNIVLLAGLCYYSFTRIKRYKQSR